MSTQFSQGDYLDMITEFTDQLQKSHTEMIENLYDPMDATMDSFFEFAGIANSAVNKIAQQHTAALESFFPQTTVREAISGTAVTSQPDTGHVAVVTGGIGDIGTDICRSLARHGNKVIATYISFDVDGLDPVYAPGTGTPEIGGITTLEAQQLLRGLRGLNLIGGDVVEVAPPFDPTGNTALVGASLMFDILCLVADSLSARQSEATD